MKCFHMLRMLACFLLAWMVPALVARAGDTRGDTRPNVVIFYTDDQGALDARCYGSMDLETPGIDELARTGVRFTQAYAHTVCCPSRAMLLTGRAPQRSGVNTWTQGDMHQPTGVNMALSEVTLAEVFQAAGYRTACIGKWHLGAAATHGPTRQGFDEYFGFRGGFIDNYRHFFLHGSGFHDLYRGTTELFMPGRYFPDLVTGEALAFIDRNRDRPFLLYLAFNLPHYPEQADPKFTRRYRHLPMPRRAYAAVVSTVDDRIARITRHLARRGLRERTIIIFMADNGYSREDYAIRTDHHASGLPRGHIYGAHGGGGNTGKWRGSKGSFFEGGIRVPAIISYPARLPSGIVRCQAITACDWMPTLLDLCGLARPAGVELDGHSLLPVILDNAPSPHKVLHWQWQNRWAVRQGDWKLIYDGRRTLLVNLADEQPEMKNYRDQKPQLVQHLTDLHQQWARRVRQRRQP